MKENKFLNEQQEQVTLSHDKKRIHIICTLPQRAYGLFDSETGTQVSNFKKCDEGNIEFNDLNPLKHYNVGVIENMGNDKPKFHISWTLPMRDETDSILSNSDNLPVEYPCVYTILDDNSKSVTEGKRVFNLVDDKKQTVAQAEELTPSDDKLKFISLHTFQMEADSKK